MTAAVPIWLSREAAMRIQRSILSGGAAGTYPIGMAIKREVTRIGETREALRRVSEVSRSRPPGRRR